MIRPYHSRCGLFLVRPESPRSAVFFFPGHDCKVSFVPQSRQQAGRRVASFFYYHPLVYLKPQGGFLVGNVVEGDIDVSAQFYPTSMAAFPCSASGMWAVIRYLDHCRLRVSPHIEAFQQRCGCIGVSEHKSCSRIYNRAEIGVEMGGRYRR
jgi:hypothetical protein